MGHKRFPYMSPAGQCYLGGMQRIVLNHLIDTGSNHGLSRDAKTLGVLLSLERAGLCERKGGKMPAPFVPTRFGRRVGRGIEKDIIATRETD